MRFALIPNCVTRAGDGLLTVRFTESMNEIRPRSARQYSGTGENQSIQNQMDQHGVARTNTDSLW